MLETSQCPHFRYFKDIIASMIKDHISKFNTKRKKKIFHKKIIGPSLIEPISSHSNLINCQNKSQHSLKDGVITQTPYLPLSAV